MPNHCTNMLTSTGDKTIGEIIKPYLSDDGKTIDCEKIIPMPEGIAKTHEFSTLEIISKVRTPEETAEHDAQRDALHEQNEKDYGYPSWYEWCVDNWGTKWGIYDCWTLEEVSEVNPLEAIQTISFQTAWSPPIPILIKLSQLTGQPLRLSYYDEAWMFGGVTTAEPDGSSCEELYEKPEDCPEHLMEELDVAFYLNNDEDDEDE